MRVYTRPIPAEARPGPAGRALNETVRCRPEGCRDNARNRAANMEAVLRRAHCNIPLTEDEGKTELGASPCAPTMKSPCWGPALCVQSPVRTKGIIRGTQSPMSDCELLARLYIPSLDSLQAKSAELQGSDSFGRLAGSPLLRHPRELFLRAGGGAGIDLETLRLRWIPACPE